MNYSVGFIDGIGGSELVLIMFIVLLLFGANRLPELARGLGKSVREFKKAASGVEEEVRRALEETPMGIQVRADAENRTSVPGIFACGDVARAPHSVSLAVGNGAMAGAQVHRSLLWPETVRPLQ